MKIEFNISSEWLPSYALPFYTWSFRVPGNVTFHLGWRLFPTKLLFHSYEECLLEVLEFIKAAGFQDFTIDGYASQVIEEK